MDVLLRSLEDGPWEPPNWNQSDFCVSVACFFDFPENYDGLKKVGLKTCNRNLKKNQKEREEGEGGRWQTLQRWQSGAPCALWSLEEGVTRRN